MDDLNLRPRFEITTSVEPNDVLRRLATALSEENAPVSGKVFDSSAILKMHQKDVQFWSPQLQISIDPHLPNGSLIHVLLGPRPAVWSLFVALYTAIGFATVMGFIFGYSQATLGQAGTAMWSGPAGLVSAGFVYLVARSGRRLGTGQMHQLKAFLEKTLDKN